MSQLRVAENPRLSVLELAQMQLVYDSIWVTNNPLLDDSALQRLNSLQSGRIRVGGNLGQPVPLAECPWVGDGRCDDTRYPLGICAEGTDPDCSLLGEE